MIQNEQYDIAFVHIPKCGGTGIRNILRPYDDLGGAFGKMAQSHPTLGRADLAHLPLSVLAAEFPQEFDKIRRYWSFAILREPGLRFASALAQRLRMYSGSAIQKQSIGRIKDEIMRTVDYLGSRLPDAGLLPPEWVHFQPQMDFVYHDGASQINRLYRIDEMDKLHADLAIRIPSLVLPNYLEKTENRSDVHRNEVLRILIEGTRPATQKFRTVLPSGLRSYLRHKVYVPRDARFSKLFQTLQVRDFLSKAYQADFVLWKDVGGQ
jgi:hypothetical protein